MAPATLTEEEVGRLDRQIRLWGIEAQQRMRNATVIVVRLRGTATEAIKNIVLAGIGRLVIVDGEEVTEEDLGAGFFFRDEDVGKKRVDAAKERIESLNPLVTVDAIPTYAVLDDSTFETTVRSANLVCVTDWDRDGLIRINEACRRWGKPFYAGGTYGLLGYIFCDLLDHEYVAPDRSAAKEAPKSNRVTVAYSPLKEALQHRWTGLTKRQTKELNPSIVFSILAIWEFQALHNGQQPTNTFDAQELESIANDLISVADVNKQVLPAISQDLVATLLTTASHEFSPVCAIVGGMLAQDILKTLAARDPSIANFFAFDGNTGGGSVCRLNMP